MVILQRAGLKDDPARTSLSRPETALFELIRRAFVHDFYDPYVPFELVRSQASATAPLSLSSIHASA
jgi:hypothetical protein